MLQRGQMILSCQSECPIFLQSFPARGEDRNHEQRGLTWVFSFEHCRVFLHATDESALQNGITMEALKKFAAEPEAAGGGGSLEKKAPIQAGTTGGIARETH